VKRKIMFFKIILLGLIIAFLIGYIPLDYTKSFDCIIYRNGDSDYSEKVIVQFDGYRFNKLYKCDEFHGTLIVDGVEYRGVKLKPGRYNEALLFALLKDIGEYSTLGMLFTDNNLNEFSIQWFEKGWSSKDGLVYSMPATTRDEAVEIADRLQHWNGKVE
jgi:hypothetical protein